MLKLRIHASMSSTNTYLKKTTQSDIHIHSQKKSSLFAILKDMLRSLIVQRVKSGNKTNKHVTTSQINSVRSTNVFARTDKQILSLLIHTQMLNTPDALVMAMRSNSVQKKFLTFVNVNHNVLLIQLEIANSFRK